jgi:hypothetical protein
MADRALLLIADIGGYTDYMRLHRTSLAHAEATTARLLKRIVKAARGFELVEIEGDAAFLSRDAGRLEDDAVTTTTRTAVAMHRAFHAERARAAANLCPCEGCALAGDLTLKFVAHVGEVATQTIERRRKLVGIDVILVHRLLKNPVSVPEYVLLSEQLYRGGTLTEPVHEVVQDLEGIGEERAYFVAIEDFPEGHVEPARPGLLVRIGETLRVLGAGVPYLVRPRRRPAETAAH